MIANSGKDISAEVHRLVPDFKEFHQSYMGTEEEPIAWHVTAMNSKDRPIGSGFSSQLETARKIAISESVERTVSAKLAENEQQRKEWQLDTLSTGCGFAVGLSKTPTIARSTQEAVERNILSQWIDDGVHMSPIDRPDFSEIDKAILTNFEDALFFYHKMVLALGDSHVAVFHTVASICLLGNGAYLGSGCKFSVEESLTHALVESMRHRLIVKNDDTADSFPYNRIQYFAKNRERALEIINKPRSRSWKTPNVIFQNTVEDGAYHICRTIVDGWESWKNGPLDRFLY